MEKQFNRQLIAQDYRAEAQRLNAAAERIEEAIHNEMLAYVVAHPVKRCG